MEYIKQSGSNDVDIHNDSNSKQLNETTIDSNNSHTKYVTHFEDLSNEVIYEIFVLLDFCHVYEAFTNLNKRFQALVSSSTLPININISSMSKSNFQHYYTHIVKPNEYRIKSLCLLNPLSVDLFLTQDCIVSKLTRLETVILNKIQSKDLENLLTSFLISLPYLSSLTIACIGAESNRNKIYHQVFRLPALKYCKMSLGTLNDSEPLSVATNEFSPIEHLIIKYRLNMSELYAVLSYVPQLRYFSSDGLYGSSDKQIIPCSSKLNYLTHASLKTSITFRQFESLTKNLLLQLQALYITIRHEESYLDADRWERLILSYMPHLQIFDIQCVLNIRDNNSWKYTIMMNQFKSKFWLDRQWFVKSYVHSMLHDYVLILHSTTPYRRKYYTLYEETSKNIFSSSHKNIIDSVHHLHFVKEQSMDDYIHYFPNATELTLSCKANYEYRSISSIILDRIVPLKQLTKLNIRIYPFCFKTMIGLLRSAPNILTLTLKHIFFDNKDLMSFQQTETFQLESARSNIKNLTITSIDTLEEIQLLIHVCPRLQCLTMHVPQNNFECILRYLLSKDNINTRDLFSLCVKNVLRDEVETMKVLIESKKILDDYLMKTVTYVVSEDIYLWW